MPSFSLLSCPRLLLFGRARQAPSYSCGEFCPSCLPCPCLFVRTYSFCSRAHRPPYALAVSVPLVFVRFSRSMRRGNVRKMPFSCDSLDPTPHSLHRYDLGRLRGGGRKLHVPRGPSHLRHRHPVDSSHVCAHHCLLGVAFLHPHTRGTLANDLSSAWACKALPFWRRGVFRVCPTTHART